MISILTIFLTLFSIYNFKEVQLELKCIYETNQATQKQEISFQLSVDRNEQNIQIEKLEKMQNMENYQVIIKYEELQDDQQKEIKKYSKKLGRGCTFSKTTLAKDHRAYSNDDFKINIDKQHIKVLSVNFMKLSEEPFYVTNYEDLQDIDSNHQQFALTDRIYLRPSLSSLENSATAFQSIF